MRAFLRSSVILSEPVATLNLAGEQPFATVDITEDGRTYFAVNTPAEARALAAAFEGAAVLLEEHARRTGPDVTP